MGLCRRMSVEGVLRIWHGLLGHKKTAPKSGQGYPEVRRPHHRGKASRGGGETIHLGQELVHDGGDQLAGREAGRFYIGSFRDLLKDGVRFFNGFHGAPEIFRNCEPGCLDFRNFEVFRGNDLLQPAHDRGGEHGSSEDLLLVRGEGSGRGSGHGSGSGRAQGILH